MIREYFGTQTACKIATLLIENSMPFDINPMPFDVFEFNIKDERANLLPPENVRRDALTESGDADAPVLKCKYCGREHESDDGLAEGDPCPSDDCPSHEYEVECDPSSSNQGEMGEILPGATVEEIIRADYSLTAGQLDDKYNPDGEGRHPIFTHWDWVQVVAQRSTLLGYWDWVAHQIEKEMESLWRTQPC